MRPIPEIKNKHFGKIDHIPAWEEIPKEFKHGHTKWNQLFSEMFYNGLAELRLAPKQGVDTQKAMAAIRSIMRSWEPKHEHKEAACAYLFSEWFDDYSTQPLTPQSGE